MLPIVAGWLRDLTGGYSVAFLALAGLSAVMLVATALFHPDREVTVE